MRVGRIGRGLIGSLVATAAQSSFAGAQTTTPPAASASGATSPVEEIVVTAEKRRDTASRIGLSITAISGGDLTKLGVTETRDLVRVVPSLTEADSPLGTPIYTLRGVGFNTEDASATSPVGVYVDQISLAYPILTSGTGFDISRVEVLEGPQGTLYGRNTTGGLISFITNKPTAHTDASVTLGYGNYKTFTSEGYLSGRLTGTLNGRIAFSTTNSDEGWQYSVTRDDRLGRVDKQAVRASLAWSPVAALDASFSFTYWRDHSDTQAPQAVYYVPNSPEPFAFSASDIGPDLIPHANNRQADWTPANVPGDNPYQERRPRYAKGQSFYGAALDLEYKLADSLTLSSLTGYNYLTRKDAYNADGTRFEISSSAAFGHIGSFSQEVRLAKTGVDYSLTGGLYYSYDDLVDNQISYIDAFSTTQLLRAVAVDIPSPYSADQIAAGFRESEPTTAITTHTASVFTSGEYGLTPNVKITAGARYSFDWNKFTGCTRDYVGNTVPIWNTAIAALAGTQVNIQPGQCLAFANDFSGPAGLIHETLNEQNFAWRANLDWYPVHGTLVYGSISRGYKAGAFPVIAGNIASQYLPANQEQVTAYEGGLKSRLFGNSFSLSLAGFYDDYVNKQDFGNVADPVFVVLQRLVNVPKSEIYGGEGSLNWQATRAFALHMAATYIHTRVIRYTGYDTFGNLIDYAGDQLPYSPTWKLSGNANYTKSLSRFDLENVLSFSYQSSSHADFQNSPLFFVSNRIVVDASVTLRPRDSKWSARLWARNLLDETYWTSANTSLDTYTRFAGLPRTFGGSLTWKLR